MRQKHYSSIIILLIFIISLTACSSNPSTGGTTSVSATPAETSSGPTAHNETIIKTTPTYAGVYSSSGSPELDLFYEHVQVSSPAAQEELQQLIDEKLNQPAEQETDYLREEYLKASTKSYYEQVVLDSRADEQVVSLLIRTTTYSQGAAHSNYSYQAITLSAQTGKPLTLSDLGVDESKARELLSGLMDAYNGQENVTHFDASDDDLTRLLDTCFLDDNMVVFASSPYQLGQPFSAGAFRFCVPYDQLGVAEQYRPEHTISEACIQDMYGARFYADGTCDEGAGSSIENLNEKHGIVLDYELTGTVRSE